MAVVETKKFKIISETVYLGKIARVGDFITLNTNDPDLWTLRSAGRIGNPEPEEKPAPEPEASKAPGDDEPAKKSNRK